VWCTRMPTTWPLHSVFRASRSTYCIANVRRLRPLLHHQLPAQVALLTELRDERISVSSEVGLLVLVINNTSGNKLLQKWQRQSASLPRYAHAVCYAWLLHLLSKSCRYMFLYSTLPVRGSWFLSNTWIHGPIRVCIPNGISILYYRSLL